MQGRGQRSACVVLQKDSSQGGLKKRKLLISLWSNWKCSLTTRFPVSRPSVRGGSPCRPRSRGTARRARSGCSRSGRSPGHSCSRPLGWRPPGRTRRAGWGRGRTAGSQSGGRSRPSPRGSCWSTSLLKRDVYMIWNAGRLFDCSLVIVGPDMTEPWFLIGVGHYLTGP